VEGKSEILAEMRKFPGNFTEDQFQAITSTVASRVGMESADDLFNMIGYGGLSVNKIINRLRDEYEKVIAPSAEVAPITSVSQIPIVEKKPSGEFGNVIVDGLEGCQVKFARCCNPLPGDNIVGFITKGYGISVHKCDCPHIINNTEQNKDRLVNVEWRKVSGIQKEQQYEALMQIVAEDRISMLADISVALAEMRVSILQINSQKLGIQSLINISVSCKNLDHFNSIISKLKSIKGVHDVTRGYAK
jgi:GTP pyrophosphokinase